jgi:hypothetical protein
MSPQEQLKQAWERQPTAQQAATDQNEGAKKKSWLGLLKETFVEKDAHGSEGTKQPPPMPAPIPVPAQPVVHTKMNYVLTDEEVTSAILFALGFKHISNNQGLELWNRFKSDPGWQADARDIAEQFGDMVEREMLHRFGFPTVARPEYEKQIVAIFFTPPIERYHKLVNLIGLKFRDCLATTDAILFALGFKHVSGNQGLELWNRFKSDPGWQADARDIAEQFGDMVEREMLHRFGFPIVARPEYEKQIVAIFFAPPKDRYHKLFNLIRLKIQNCLAAMSHQAAMQYAAVAPNPRLGPLSNSLKAGHPVAASGLHPGAVRPAPPPQGGAIFISPAKPAPQGGATFVNQPMPATPTRAENLPVTQPPESRITTTIPETQPQTKTIPARDGSLSDMGPPPPPSQIIVIP